MTNLHSNVELDGRQPPDQPPFHAGLDPGTGELLQVRPELVSCKFNLARRRTVRVHYLTMWGFLNHRITHICFPKDDHGSGLVMAQVAQDWHNSSVSLKFPPNESLPFLHAPAGKSVDGFLRSLACAVGRRGLVLRGLFGHVLRCCGICQEIRCGEEYKAPEPANLVGK